MLTGVLVLAPLVATINILKWLIINLDNTVSQFLPARITQSYPGLGLASVFLLILIIGTLTQNIVGQWFVNLLDTGVKKLPLVGGIYTTIKKFLATIVNPGSDKFSGVVLVQFPRTGVYSIGFRTGKPDPKIVPKSIDNEQSHLVNVFVPCTPNPTSGFYLWVKEQDLTPLDMSVQEAFKTVVSMGIISGEEH